MLTNSSGGKKKKDDEPLHLIAFRTSLETREALKKKAKSEGFSVQRLFARWVDEYLSATAAVPGERGGKKGKKGRGKRRKD